VGHEPVTLCHKGHEITVDAHAVPAHEAHGDSIVDSGGAVDDGSDAKDDTVVDEGSNTQDDSTEPEDQEQDDAEDGCQSEETPTQELKPGDTEPGDTEQGDELQQDTRSDILQQKPDSSDEQAAPEKTEEVKTCDGGHIELSKAEKLTLDLHNKTRKENSLKPLCLDSTLTRAAREHSKDMAKRDYFDHKSSRGEGTAERLRSLGYEWSAAGENLARGSGSSSTAKNRFEAWMKSKGHRLNILNERYEQVGVGVVRGESRKSGKEQTVYTVDFGRESKR